VEKKGSMALFSVSSSIPDPESVIAILRYDPERRPLSASIRFESTSISILPPSGIASLALIARLRIASSTWLASTCAGGSGSDRFRQTIVGGDLSPFLLWGRSSFGGSRNGLHELGSLACRRRSCDCRVGHWIGWGIARWQSSEAKKGGDVLIGFLHGLKGESLSKPTLDQVNHMLERLE
jgi:hypothetical protein